MQCSLLVKTAESFLNIFLFNEQIIARLSLNFKFSLDHPPPPTLHTGKVVLILTMRGGGDNWPIGEIMFFHSKQQKTYQWTVGTPNPAMVHQWSVQGPMIVSLLCVHPLHYTFYMPFQ